MMKYLVISLIALCCCASMYGQHVTRKYDNVSMSEALRDLNEQSRDYTISFMYNELEDFRVATSIKHKTVTEAIMQIVGFYPVRVVNRGENEIFVECTHKTERHLTGTIIDENRQPTRLASSSSPTSNHQYWLASHMSVTRPSTNFATSLKWEQ